MSLLGAGPGEEPVPCAERESIRTGVQATGWSADGRLQLTSARGREVLKPEVLILATGARERPRTARMIPGDRGAGIYTTDQLQQLVHLKHQPKIGRAHV